VNGNRQIAQIFVPLTGAPGNPALTSAAIFQTLFAQNKVQCSVPTAPNVSCITPADLTQFGINITHTGPVPPLSVIFSAQPDYQNPYSQQAEFGIEREVAPGWSASLSGIYVHTIGLPVAVDKNALPTAPLSAPTTLANGTQVRFKQWSAAFFANPLILQDNVYSSKGSALYEGAVLTITKRMSHHFSLFGSYTLSKAFDTTTDFNSDFGPQDQTNLAAERGLSDFDQRHKIVAYAAIETGKSGNPFFSNFQFAPVFRYNSGHPFNLLAGADVNGDRHSTNDRPIGAAHNTGLGPDFFSFDMRISRRVKLSEKSELQVMAEGFNLFNRTNYASVNNVVGSTFGLASTTFNVKGSAAIDPTSPLGFTSAFPMRQLQLGARIAF
jgi:hypothetical protein